MRILALLLVAGCAGESTIATPTIQILAPADGAAVPAGDVAVSFIVEDFALVTPAAAARVRRVDPTAWLSPAAWAHGDEEGAQGWLSVDLDGVHAANLGDTQGTLTGVGVGSHQLTVTLIHEDGEPVEPAVTASATFQAE